MIVSPFGTPRRPAEPPSLAASTGPIQAHPVTTPGGNASPWLKPGEGQNPRLAAIPTPAPTLSDGNYARQGAT